MSIYLGEDFHCDTYLVCSAQKAIHSKKTVSVLQQYEPLFSLIHSAQFFIVLTLHCDKKGNSSYPLLLGKLYGIGKDCKKWQ